MGPADRAISSPVDRIDDAIAVAGDGRIERRRLVRDRQVQRVPLDAHLAAPHRVALDLAAFRNDAALARQAKTAAAQIEMPFALRRRREQLHPARDLDDAFLAFALVDAGGRHADAGLFGGGEERHAHRIASIRCPLTVSVAGMDVVRLTSRRRASSSSLTASRDFLGRALALLLVAPSPLREVVVGALQPALRRPADRSAP